MTDRYAVIWTRTPEGPVKMGNLVATERECRFSYTEDFLASGRPGLSLLAPPALFQREPVVYPSSERMPLHPRLMSLTPGETPGNLQRRILTEILSRREPPPAPGFETEWALLMMAGRDGIGHLDIFPDDLEAEAWYRAPQHPQHLIGKRSAVWKLIREEVRQSAGDELDMERIAELLGPTPSVGGMIPKLLATIPDRPEWDGRFAPPSIPDIDGESCIDVILKIEPAIYPGVLELEALCLDLHAGLGLETPRFWRAEVDGMELLAIERFDRTAERLPVPMESFLSVMAAGSRDIRGTGDTELRALGRMIEKLGTLANLDVRATQREVYHRFLLAFFTGNGDLHLENLSFLGGPEDVRLAPVYDPAPMRAWPRHNLRSAIPIEFDPALGLGDNLAELGTAFGMSRPAATELIRQTLDDTRDYAERVMTLERVPMERRQVLAALIENERKAVLSTLTAS
ncbi:MAG TPA: type II toxin-antitoxin system HipA family toxin [Anaerolineae bacterium]|nr:type II toxin-antitoxin system HipA family toxin [Anaerolineae bacterium]